MKKSIFGASVIGIIAFSAFTFNADTYKVDTKLSSLEWTGKKIGGEHNGTISLSSGSLMVQNNEVVGGALEVDMKSVKNKDVQDSTWRHKFDEHLMGPDFFDSEKFPKAKFEITSVTPIKDSKDRNFTHSVKGKLTIKDKTNEITFNAMVKSQDGKIACVATVIIDRTKFDIKYGSKIFFSDIGDKMVYDEFTLKFNVVATKQ